MYRKLNQHLNQIDMKASQEFKLIKGTFSTDDAESVLLALLNHKIKYHQGLIFSNEERYGKDNSNSVRRIEELKGTRANLRAFLEEAKIQGFNIEIQGDVKLTLQKHVGEFV